MFKYKVYIIYTEAYKNETFHSTIINNTAVEFLMCISQLSVRQFSAHPPVRKTQPLHFEQHLKRRK